MRAQREEEVRAAIATAEAVIEGEYFDYHFEKDHVILNLSVHCFFFAEVTAARTAASGNAAASDRTASEHLHEADEVTIPDDLLPANDPAIASLSSATVDPGKSLNLIF